MKGIKEREKREFNPPISITVTYFKIISRDDATPHKPTDS